MREIELGVPPAHCHCNSARYPRIFHTCLQQTWLRLLDLPELLDDSEDDSVAIARTNFELLRYQPLVKLGDYSAAQERYLESEAYYTQAIQSLQERSSDVDSSLLGFEIKLF